MSRLSDRRAATSYHHGSLAAALIDEGVAQVRERGAERVSLRALAATVGVSPSAAYQHFGDKDDLLLAVGRRGFDQLAARMQAGIDAVTGSDPAAALARMSATGTAYVGFAAEEPHLFRLMFGPLCRKPEDGEHGGAYTILQQRLAELEELGLLRVPADEALQLLIWSVVHGFSSLVIEDQVDITAGTMLFATLQALVLEPPRSP